MLIYVVVGFFFFFQAEDGIRDYKVTGVQTCALPICMKVDLALPNSDSYSSQTLAKVRQNLGTDVVVLGSYLDSSDAAGGSLRLDLRSEERRVGKECRSRWSPYH